MICAEHWITNGRPDCHCTDGCRMMTAQRQARAVADKYRKSAAIVVWHGDETAHPCVMLASQVDSSVMRTIDIVLPME